jgi:hypothetical protein
VKKIRVVGVLVLVCIATFGIATPAFACDADDAFTVGCPGGAASASIANGGVAVGATQTRTKPRSAESGRKGGGGKITFVPPPTGPWSDPFDSTATPIMPDSVTVSDLVNFKPVPGVDHMEPNGWVIVGLDTNFYATVQPQVQSGLLLGQQASVRFTAAGFHWSYGDGHGRSAATRGATWKALGVREFDPTGTSHVYDKRGEYDIDLTIDFTAEYQYAGGPWTPVIGVLPVPANRLHASAGEAKTVLVEQNCLTRPNGPGC